MKDTTFFGASDPDTRPQYTLTDIRNARRICVGCPVRRQCLRYTLTHADEYGVFAGSTKKNRIGILRRVRSGVTTMEEEIDAFMTWLEGLKL